MLEAPLKVTVQVRLLDGSAAGERRFRLSHRLELPPALWMPAPLPLEGEGRGEVSFSMPDGVPVVARARLYFDPEHPDRGSTAELVNLPPELLTALQTYIEDHKARIAP